MKKHLFNAESLILLQAATQETAKAILYLNGIELSLMKSSCCSNVFQPLVNEVDTISQEVLGIHYQVISNDSANLQFWMIPFNLFKKKA
jgi:phosphoserine aminotransferase